ncbi:TPA: hypothetical protein ACN311_000754 [Vibrio parahaemolyticus]
MMEHLIYNRHKGILSAMLISAAAFYGLTTASPANALTEQPIYPDPANSANSCMADAYFDTGGSGMKGTLGEALNCTANDVEITQVIPKEIILPDGSSSGNLTCTLGETFKLKADIRVRANAAERWDTTFYVPRKENVDPDVIYQDGDACSVLLPVPVGAGGFDPDFLVAQQLDGDACGDIKKSELTADEYTLEDAVFEIICEDDGLDGQADFNYCAAWDNIERDNCSEDSAYPGQVPNNKSKCKCDNFNIPVFIKPNPPTVLKSVEPASSNEPAGTFKYTLTITKAAGSAVQITSLSDIYRSSTDGSIFEQFDLTGGADNQGTLNLLDTAGNPNTCKSLSYPIILTDTTPSTSCSFYVQINDEDLPDDPAPTTANAAGQPEELYQNFIRFSATDNEGRGTVIGDDTCDPTDGDATNDDGNCSNVVTVKMINVDPAVDITKTPISGPGLRNVAGAWYIDDEGLITYEVTVTNLSTVDSAWVIQLVDDNGTPGNLADDINLLADSTGSPACNTAPDNPNSDTPLAKMTGSFTCRYTVDVTVADGSTYTNTVNVIINDNEARAANDMAVVSVTRAEPVITLVKDVAVSVDANVPTPAIDSASFMQSINVDEPGDEVVYRFTMTNANAVTKEDLTVISLTDDVLFSSVRASASSTQRSDECSFPQVIEYGTPYMCTLVADVTGNGSNDPNTDYDDTFLLNTAFVTAKRDPNDASEPETKSNEDTAQVNFDNVLPQFEANFGFHANVFVKVTNSSTFEDITLNKMSIRGVSIPDSTTPGDVDVGTLFRIFDDSGTSIEGVLDSAFQQLLDGYCNVGQTIPAGETYACFVRVQLFNALGIFDTFSASGADDGIVIEVLDDDGSIRAAEVEVTVQTQDVIQP